MNVPHEINRRTVKLVEILGEANSALVQKNSVTARDIDGVPESIEEIVVTAGIQPGDLEDIEVISGRNDRTISPPAGKGYANITVKGEPNLFAENIAKGKNLFGITGTYPRPDDMSDAFITPEPGDKEYFIPEGYAGIKYIRVYGDKSLTPENIISGVSIFNVAGNYQVHPQYNVKYTENDVFYVDPPTNYSAMKRVRVTVDVPQRGMVKETINAVINANGNYTYTPSINATYQGLGLVKYYL